MRALTTRLHPVTAVIGAILTLLVLAWIMLVGLAQNAAAQGQACGPRELIVGRLAERFGETRRGIGLATQNRVLEVFASDATGTWTITVTTASGHACLLASGHEWEDRMDDLAHLSNDPT